MKFQIVLAAIFAFVAVSTKKGYCYGGGNQIQNANLCNNASSQGNALAINSACIGNANAWVDSNAANYNCVSQNQHN